MDKFRTMDKSAAAVLVIDDERQIRRFLKAGFELEGYRVREAENAEEGLKSAILYTPDLIILDLGLPDLGGMEVLERIRSWSNVPVIVLSIISDSEEKVRLLRLGADDYVAKPFEMAELLARCDAALRRYYKSPTEDSVVKAGGLVVDIVARSATSNGKRISLTRKEYSLLHILAKHAGLVVAHEQLLKEIWGASQVHNIQYLRVLVRKLRTKVEDSLTNPKIILTESGVGYRLQPDVKVVEGRNKTRNEPLKAE
jgi:two-component system KDP operon response regulator KdpE